MAWSPNRVRPNKLLRGYGKQHQQIRAAWAPYVAAGLVDCWRCGRRIPPGGAWDLGHDDHDRTRYRGPEHPKCNRGTNRRSQPPTDDRPDPQGRSTTQW